MCRIVIDLNPDSTHAAVRADGYECWADVLAILTRIITGNIRLASYQSEYGLPIPSGDRPDAAT